MQPGENMKTTHLYHGAFALAAAALLAMPSQGAQLLLNNGFESGFSNWTRADQLGSDGTFLLQTGTTSPVNGFPVPLPPGPTQAAMSDAEGPGSHVLYQDFMVPSVANSFVLTFQLFLNNTATTYSTPSTPTLDFSTAALNQQFRVDVLKTTAGVFSVTPADILLNVYQTKAGDPARSGYTTVTADLTGVLAGNLGQTLRLRFAETDNVAPFVAGIDNVSISDVPEPSTVLAGLALLSLAIARYRRPS